jgi:hypothetical protein
MDARIKSGHDKERKGVSEQAREGVLTLAFSSKI